jgi:excisionase family DNA binding protein
MSRRHTPPAEASTPVAPRELPLLLTVEQAAAECQCGRTHAWRLVNAGVLPSIRLSPRVVRVPRDALLAFIAAGGVRGTRADQGEPIKLHDRAV